MGKSAAGPQALHAVYLVLQCFDDLEGCCGLQQVGASDKKVVLLASSKRPPTGSRVSSCGVVQLQCSADIPQPLTTALHASCSPHTAQHAAQPPGVITVSCQNTSLAQVGRSSTTLLHHSTSQVGASLQGKIATPNSAPCKAHCLLLHTLRNNACSPDKATFPADASWPSMRRNSQDDGPSCSTLLAQASPAGERARLTSRSACKGPSFSRCSLVPALSQG